MTVDKMSVSFGHELGDAVREAARRSGVGLSAWLASAAEARLRADALAEFLNGWERTHAPLTPAEIEQAERELGLRSPTGTA